MLRFALEVILISSSLFFPLTQSGGVESGHVSVDRNLQGVDLVIWPGSELFKHRDIKKSGLFNPVLTPCQSSDVLVLLSWLVQSQAFLKPRFNTDPTHLWVGSVSLYRVQQWLDTARHPAFFI